MTQSLIGNSVYEGQSLLEKAHSAGIGDFLEIRQGDNRAFDKKRFVKPHRNTPEYRRMRCYVKSIEQYKRERVRRKRVRQLNSEGKTYPQIAKELGISERTVARDMKKQKHYQTGQFRKALRKIEQDQIDKFNKETEHLSNVQKFRLLADLIVKQETLFKIREYNRHAIKIIIDMNDLTDGCPSIRFWPKPPWSLTKPIHFDFYIQHGEKRTCLGGLTQN